MRELIEDGIRRILQDHVTPGLLLQASRGVWPAALWQLLEESGFSRALCSAPYGGSDASWIDIHPLLVASGYYCLPLPLSETVCANRLLEASEIEAPDGAIGFADPLASTTLVVHKTAQGWRLSGELRHVPWGRHCKHLVTQFDHEGEQFIALLETSGLSMRMNLNLAREPRDTFVLQNTPALKAAVYSAEGSNPMRLYGALLRSAQMAGASQYAMEQAIRYAGERIQFGRALAKFQAVQQQIAAAVSEVAAITAAADYACNAAETSQAETAVAVAKVIATDTANKVSSVAHAIHGAIGFTAEHTLHYATQRLWAWRSEFGSARWWSEGLGRAVCLQGADLAWATLIDAQLRISIPSSVNETVRTRCLATPLISAWD
jgi:acyl-CoA dehydrogenase